MDLHRSYDFNHRHGLAMDGKEEQDREGIKRKRRGRRRKRGEDEWRDEKG